MRKITILAVQLHINSVIQPAILIMLSIFKHKTLKLKNIYRYLFLDFFVFSLYLLTCLILKYCSKGCHNSDQRLNNKKAQQFSCWAQLLSNNWKICLYFRQELPFATKGIIFFLSQSVTNEKAVLNGCLQYLQPEKNVFLRRDSEKSLENWVRMDLNRSLFLYCKKPLVCYPISKWGQLVANSGPLQELQVFSYPAEKGRALCLE